MNTLMIIASLILLTAPVIYITRVSKGLITPNPVTFLVRSVVAIMHLFTYFFTVGGDLFKLSMAFVSALGLSAIFIYSFKKGKFSKISGFDIALGFVAFVAAMLWKFGKDPVIANLCLQIAILITFLPAIKGVLTGVAREEVLPWALPTVSYALMICAFMLDGATTWQQLVNPLVGMIGNGGLALTIAYKNQKQKSPHP